MRTRRSTGARARRRPPRRRGIPKASPPARRRAARDRRVHPADTRRTQPPRRQPRRLGVDRRMVDDEAAAPRAFRDAARPEHDFLDRIAVGDAQQHRLALRGQLRGRARGRRPRIERRLQPRRGAPPHHHAVPRTDQPHHHRHADLAEPDPSQRRHHAAIRAGASRHPELRAFARDLGPRVEHARRRSRLARTRRARRTARRRRRSRPACRSHRR